MYQRKGIILIRRSRYVEYQPINPHEHRQKQDHFSVLLPFMGMGDRPDLMETSEIVQDPPANNKEALFDHLVERIFRVFKRRKSLFSNRSTRYKPEAAKTWLQSFARWHNALN